MKAKNFKARVASALTALALLATPLLVTPVSAAGEPSISVGSASAKAGDTVTVDVTLSENPGVCCMVLDVEYDKSALSLEAVELAPGMKGMLEFGVRIVWLNMGGDINYNGKFVTLTFKVLEDAAIGEEVVSLSYKDGDICNYDEVSVDFVTRDGTISILDGAAEIPGAGTNEQNGNGDIGTNAGDSGSGSASGSTPAGDSASVSDVDSASGSNSDLKADTDSENADKSEASDEETKKDQDTTDPEENRLPVIIAVSLVVLVAVGTCVFAVVKSKKSGDSN